MATEILSMPSNMTFGTALNEQLSAPIQSDDYKILTALKALHPGPSTLHVALLDGTFQLSAYLLSEQIDVQIQDAPRHEIAMWDSKVGAGSAAGLHPQFNVLGADSAQKGELGSRLRTGSMRFTHDGTDFLVYKVTYGQRNSCLYDIVFDAPEDVVRAVKEKLTTQTAGHALATAVYRWFHAVKDEMWVFENGAWGKDKALWGAIRNASWDDIVLEEEFLEGLRRDTSTFFENRDIYQELGVVWKRGLLLLGPPGNGKTESIKVLLRESGQTALYVKSFTTVRGPEAGVRSIFDFARSNAPCILVIEDLDSLVTSNVRSFFLNELDGLGQNEGILTIATTNHPELIDDAILNRPSRFDVKYDFTLPTESLRATYALKWIRKVTSMAASSRPTSRKTIVRFEQNEDELAETVAKKTAGWSFAFLKELFVSFLLRLAHDKTRSLARGTSDSSSQPPFCDAILMNQIDSLSKQIVNVTSGSGVGLKKDNPQTITGPIDHLLATPVGMSVNPKNTHPGTNF